jgi:hypothetical protein
VDAWSSLECGRTKRIIVRSLIRVADAYPR